MSERLSTCTEHEDKFVVVYHGAPWDCPVCKMENALKRLRLVTITKAELITPVENGTIRIRLKKKRG